MTRPRARRPAIAGLLLAELVSSLGSQMTRLALPWFVLTETGSPARMTYVLAAGLLPVAILGVPAGTLIDRIGARRAMVASDLASAPVVALVPSLQALGALSFPTLIALAVLLGALSAPYYASQRLVLVEVLGEDERAVTQASSLLEGTTETTNLLGPVLAGLLIVAIGASRVLWLDAGSYAVSAAVLLVALPRGVQVSRDTASSGVLAGTRLLISDPILSRFVAASVVFGLGGPMLVGALPYLGFARYHHDARLTGLLITCWGAGAVAGSALAFRLLRRLPPLGVASFGVIGFVLPLWLLVVALPPWAVGAVLALSGLANPSTNALGGVVMLRVPADVRAKVMTGLITMNLLVGPAGYVIAGLVLERIGISPLFLLLATMDTLAAVVFLTAAHRAAGLRTEPVLDELVEPEMHRPTSGSQESSKPPDRARS